MIGNWKLHATIQTLLKQQRKNWFSTQIILLHRMLFHTSKVHNRLRNLIHFCLHWSKYVASTRVAKYWLHLEHKLPPSRICQKSYHYVKAEMNFEILDWALSFSSGPSRSPILSWYSYWFIDTRKSTKSDKHTRQLKCCHEKICNLSVPTNSC